jgi:F0F1-type ATP synthase membrane subunit c/vacuolar-type H+-ATPase subunit K
MKWGFTWLLEFVNKFWATVVEVFTWLVDGVLYVLGHGLWLIWDGMLTAVAGVITGISLGNLTTSMSSAWGVLPPQVVWWVNAVSLPAGLGIIVSAIVIRMLLNLIPGALTRI